MSSPEMLNEKNWLKWRDIILDKALEFGDAGRTIKTSKATEFRTPMRTDERECATGVILSRLNAAIIVRNRTQQLIDEGSEEDEAASEAALLFEPAFDDDDCIGLPELLEAKKEV